LPFGTLGGPKKWVEFQRFDVFSAFSQNVGETGHMQRFEVFAAICTREDLAFLRAAAQN